MARGSFILASASERRRELLTRIGLDFEIAVAPIQEKGDGPESPAERAVINAKLKAAAVARRRPDCLVLGADTIVVLGEVVLGKPAGPDEARWMLSVLSGRVHRVITGFALIHRAALIDHADFVSTQVKIKPLTEAEIKAYVATGEPLDKAGAYAIQGIGAGLVEWIRGSYTNVVGLPLAQVLDRLDRLGGVRPLMGSGR